MFIESVKFVEEVLSLRDELLSFDDHDVLLFHGELAVFVLKVVVLKLVVVFVSV